MPTTTERLEAITDTAVFETLAIRVLRETDGDCKAIVHLGMNAEGKTIPGSIDGFIRVPGSSPARFVASAFATTAPAGMRRKWLDDPVETPKPAKANSPKTNQAKLKQGRKQEKGDLLKAAEAARNIRKTDPSAEFIVYLCSNRRLTLELMTSAYVKAKELQVEVRFLDQTKLRDFLDGEPYGQWLRREHLGTDIDQISVPMLEEAANLSQSDYLLASLPLSEAPVIETEQSDHLKAALQEHSSSMFLLLGASGAGKSILAHNLQKSILSTGGCAFWIPCEVAERSLSPADALEAVLRSYFPTLSPGSGQAAMQLVGEKLVLIIDDINRATAPTNLLAKIVRWGAPSVQDGKTARPSFQMVCPVWPSHWATLSYRLEREQWLRIETIRPFIRQESLRYLTAALPGHSLSDMELARLAASLNDDPILLALFADTLRRSPNHNRMHVAENVLAIWCATVLKEFSDKTHIPVSEYESSLSILAHELLLHRVLYPEKSELFLWITSFISTGRNIALLAESGHICTFRDSSLGTTRFQFRHDRIMEFYLSRAISRALEQGVPFEPAIWDPYFAVFLWRAVATEPPAEQTLDEIQEKSPVALIAAIQYLRHSNELHRAPILQRARAWLRSGEQQRTAQHQFAISLLKETISPDVLAVTDALALTFDVSLARMANGDLRAGMNLLANEFWPSMSAAWFDSLLNQGINRDPSQAVVVLEQNLDTSPDSDPWRRGLLSIAGYVGTPISAETLHRCWQRSKDKKATVQAALWAVLRCDVSDPSIVSSMLDTILKLKHDPTGKSSSERYNVMQGLGWAAKHHFTDSALTVLVQLAATKKYRTVLTMFLAEVRSPITIGFVVRELAEWSHKAVEKNSFSPFSSSWTDSWRRWKEGRDDLTACNDVVFSMWNDPEEPKWIREYAMRVWSETACSPEPLRTIAKGDDLYKEAVWYRLRLGDSTLGVDDLSSLHPRALEYVGRAWNPGVEPLLENRFKAHFANPTQSHWSNEDHTLAHALRDMPSGASERLLLRHWGEARHRPLFIQLALYLSSEQSRALAADALRNPPVDAFKHIDHFFGFGVYGLSDRISTAHLESLLPYVSLLSGFSLGHLIEFCGRHGRFPWARANLERELARRRLLDKTENDGEYLDRILRHWMPTEQQLFAEFDWISEHRDHFVSSLSHFVERFIEQEGTTERFCIVAKKWFDMSPSQERLSILAATVEYWGKRSDLSLIESLYIADAPVFPRLEDVKYNVMRRSLD